MINISSNNIIVTLYANGRNAFTRRGILKTLPTNYRKNKIKNHNKCCNPW